MGDAVVAKSSSMELSQTEALQRKGGLGANGSGGCLGAGTGMGLEGGGRCVMGGAGGPPVPSDAELHELLEDVRLEDLCARVSAHGQLGLGG